VLGGGGGEGGEGEGGGGGGGGALSGVRGGCINVKFHSEISCSDFDSCGEFLENNYAKKTQSR